MTNARPIGRVVGAYQTVGGRDGLFERNDLLLPVLIHAFRFQHLCTTPRDATRHDIYVC